jgi:hypothetical protein
LRKNYEISPDTIQLSDRQDGASTFTRTTPVIHCDNLDVELRTARTDVVKLRAGTVIIVEPTSEASSTSGSPTSGVLHSDEVNKQSEPTGQETEIEGSDSPEGASGPLNDDQAPHQESSDLTDPTSESER